MKKQNGITLIALVITVIVVLILAGITINLSIGEDGIIKRAEQAGKNYQQAANDEKTELAEFTNLTDRLIDNVTKNHYTIVEGVPVPKGFSHIEGTKDTGFVIKNDTDGNEFVWVPCTIDGANGSVKYDRYPFGNFLNSGYSEEMASDEKNSVKEYGGFYIGRYETGITEYASVNTSTNNTENDYTGYVGGKVIVQKEQQVWNYITRDKAKSISEGLYRKLKGDSVNSKLCSSYAWDTALKFIEKTYPAYPTESTQGNYSNKSQTLGAPAKTGLTQEVNNIYDMGGNVWEWTTEKTSDDASPGTPRGGYCSESFDKYPAGSRGYGSMTYATAYVSFRTTLYL